MEGESKTDNVDSIILEEEIDPNYVPSEAEVVEYAKWLGMDLEKDQDLYWIAREGLKAPLPENWKPCKTKDTDDIYYFNFTTGESTWDHPCDGFYKRLYEEEKKKKEISIKVHIFEKDVCMQCTSFISHSNNNLSRKIMTRKEVKQSKMYNSYLVRMKKRRRKLPHWNLRVQKPKSTLRQYSIENLYQGSNH